MKRLEELFEVREMFHILIGLVILCVYGLDWFMGVLCKLIGLCPKSCAFYCI